MKSEIAYLRDILESAHLIQNYIAGVNRDPFDEDTKLQDAIIRRLEIIGEVTKRLSESFRSNHPHLPWKQMAGMRDFLIHDYDVVDLDLVWDTATQSIPALIAQIEPLIPPNAADDKE
jgi:uncharacterized protein with HEPN domain